jgi:integrase
MPTHNARNERIKRRYFAFLKEAHRQSQASVDAAAKAITRFEQETRYRDFQTFHHEQAISFKRALRDGGKATLSVATLATVLSHLKRFFVWLADQPGYRSRLKYCDADYFNLGEKESRVANARRERPGPTLEQVRHVIATMPAKDAVQKRDRAILAFTLLTGARDGALISFQLKHLDLSRRCVDHDARTVKTKYSKTFTTYFFPVGADIVRILESWVQTLREEHLWGNDDPLFPATRVQVGSTSRFEVMGLSRSAWSTASPVRQIFRRAFETAGLPYFNPHSIRKTLVQLGQNRCQTPEEFKAWSQNLGHEGVLTTFQSYGSVSAGRQAEIIADLAGQRKQRDLGAEVADLLFQRLAEAGSISLVQSPTTKAPNASSADHEKGGVQG